MSREPLIKAEFSGSPGLSVPEFPLNFPVQIPLPYVGPFVVRLLALAQPKLHLHPALLEVERQGDKRETLFLDLAGYPFDLVAVQKKPLFAVGVVVEHRGKRVFRHPQGAEPDLARDHLRPCIGERNLSVAEGFYLRTQKLDAAFVSVVHGIIEPRLAVHGDCLYSLGHLGLPPLRVGRALSGNYGAK